MASKRQQEIGAALDDRALLVEGGDALRTLALLVRAIDRRNLWPVIAWEPEAAQADAHRAVARVRRALEQQAARAGEYSE